MNYDEEISAVDDVIIDEQGIHINTNAYEPHEIMTAVVLTKCPVVSYNKHSGVLVYERDGKLIQTSMPDYSDEGYVEVE